MKSARVPIPNSDFRLLVGSCISSICGLLSFWAFSPGKHPWAVRFLSALASMLAFFWFTHLSPVVALGIDSLSDDQAGNCRCSGCRRRVRAYREDNPENHYSELTTKFGPIHGDVPIVVACQKVISNHCRVRALPSPG